MGSRYKSTKEHALVLNVNNITREERVIFTVEQPLRIDADLLVAAIDGDGRWCSGVVVFGFHDSARERQARLPVQHGISDSGENSHLRIGGKLLLLLLRFFHLRAGCLLAGGVGSADLHLLFGFVRAAAGGQKKKN